MDIPIRVRVFTGGYYMERPNVPKPHRVDGNLNHPIPRSRKLSVRLAVGPDRRRDARTDPCISQRSSLEQEAHAKQSADRLFMRIREWHKLQGVTDDTDADWEARRPCGRDEEALSLSPPRTEDLRS